MRAVSPIDCRKVRRFIGPYRTIGVQRQRGKVESEKPIRKPSGRTGRIDIHVESDGNLVAVVEIKDSDWEAMTDAAVKRNVRRQIRQIWSYVEPQLELGNDVSPGIVFPKRPNDPVRVDQIESMFGEECIAVFWGSD